MFRTFLQVLCYQMCDAQIQQAINEDVQMYKKYCHLEHFKGSPEVLEL